MRRNLFLYLVLACFVGIIAIFIVDGYMGVYDTIYITTGEYEQRIEPDFWIQQDRFWTTGIKRGDIAYFRYEVDNRQFSSYGADVDISVWHGQVKERDLLAQPISISSFGKGQLEWVIDTTALVPGDIPPEQSYDFTVVVKRGELERRIIMYVSPVPSIPKPVPSRIVLRAW